MSATKKKKPVRQSLDPSSPRTPAKGNADDSFEGNTGVDGIRKWNELVLSTVPPSGASKESRRFSAFFNPVTMRQLELGAQDLVTITASSSDDSPRSTACCFAWPSTQLKTSEIYLDATAKENCGASAGQTVTVQVIAAPQCLPRATVVELRASSPLDDVSTPVAQLIVSQHLAGVYVAVGNVVSLPMLGKTRRLQVVRIEIDQTQPLFAAHASCPGRLVVPESQISIIADSPTQDPTLAADTEEAHAAVSSEMVGGLSEQLGELREMVMLALCDQHLTAHFGLRPPKGVLLYGPPGTGKTLLARVIAAECKAHLVTINGPDFISAVHGESEAALRETFADAVRRAPTLIFIDELDAVAAARDEATQETDRRVVSTLLSLLDGVNANAEAPERVFVIGATNRPDSLDAALRRPGRLDREIEIGIPNTAQRLEILRVFLRRMPHALTPADADWLASVCHGYIGADIQALCKEAGLRALKRLWVDRRQPPSLESLVVSADDFRAALTDVRPSAMREVVIDVPRVRWEDIGGNADVKQKLREAIEWPLKRPDVFLRMGVKPPKGILLYGPPGCSKTLMAKALATETGLNFLAVKGPEIFSKWVGESEKAIREIFRKARAAAPSIVFFDEIDAIAVARGSSQGASGGVSSVTDRVLSQLITELDGITPLKDVCLVAATNRPDILDKALLRGGRIDRILYVGPPDDKAREEIFRIQLRPVPHDDPAQLPRDLAGASFGFSGAEIVAACREASLRALEEDINAAKVTRAHLMNAILNVKPGITAEMVAFYHKFKATCGIDSIQ
eukprot:TRINITY_DN7385_c0_g1_i1.p1 TRINITY_DN7385_c0_g1~~TRINITY_DN7385_c0_g1_i1.p1  ORF type:complete len:797 (+),score=223.51 TRINITY_DN7385_c0_g1_i1:46-2436(+)